MAVVAAPSPPAKAARAGWCSGSCRGMMVGLTVALICCLTSCTRLDGQNAPVDTNPPSIQVSDSVTAGLGPTRDDLPFAPFVSVISAFTSVSHSVNDEVLRNRWDEIQAFQAECMKNRGFTYYPEPWAPVGDDRGFFADGDQLVLPHLPGDREEAARIGYGLLPPEELLLWDSDEAQRNALYRESLSRTAQIQYDLALKGDPNTPSESESVKSCGLLSIEKNPSPEFDLGAKGLFRTHYSALILAMHELVYEEVMEDPRTLFLNATWGACMEDRGFSLISGFYWNEHNISPWAAQTLALRTRADGSLGDTWYNYQYDEITPAEERSLLGTEIEVQIALADYDCRQESGYMERYLAIQIELESEFVEQHHTQLDEMMAFAEEHG